MSKKGFALHVLASVFIFLDTGVSFPAPGPSPLPRATIRFMLPSAPFSREADEALEAAVEEYNRSLGKKPGHLPVELIRRGEGFSALRELVASHLAGELPDIAAIDSSEYPALTRLNIVRSLRPKGLPASASEGALPFRGTVAVLVADQEMLFRARANPNELPKNWAAVLQLARKLLPSGPESALETASHQPSPFGLPLQGRMGLWLFEAVGGQPLWSREAGGLRANRELTGTIAGLQALMDAPPLVNTDENWERAIQAFLNRKSPLLATSLDFLPYIQRQAPFRWTATLLPPFSHPRSSRPAPLLGGSVLVVTQESPALQAFLDFLYRNDQAIRWVTAAHCLPLKKEWLKSQEWKKATASFPLYRDLIQKIPSTRPRTTDPEVVRAHSEWIQALRLLFGDATRRVPTDRVLTQMDSRLTLK